MTRTDFTITIRGNRVEAVSPEQQTATMPVEELRERMVPQDRGTGDAALPAGMKFIRSRGRVVVWVHETPPQVWNLKWIKASSKKAFDGASYRNVIISLPYIVVVAAFVPRPDGFHTLSDSNECFFRTAPLDLYDKDELYVPALLNCSLFASPHGKKKIGVDGRSVVWICTQNLDRAAFSREPHPDRRMMTEFRCLMDTLLSTGFNYSSEHHEFASGFTESLKIDPRISGIEAWEQATRDDAEFALTVPWLRTGYTVKEVVNRIFKHCGAGRDLVRSAHDIARILFRQNARKRKPA